LNRSSKKIRYQHNTKTQEARSLSSSDLLDFPWSRSRTRDVEKEKTKSILFVFSFCRQNEKKKSILFFFSFRRHRVNQKNQIGKSKINCRFDPVNQKLSTESIDKSIESN